VETGSRAPSLDFAARADEALGTGGLQTEDYARAVLAAAHPAAPDGEVDRLVSARLDRQAILAREAPPLLWVIVDEGVLTRPVGGAGVMREQIGRLIAAARQPKIVLQVLPASAGAHPGLAGQFVIAGVRRCGGRRLPGQCPGRPGRGAGRRRGQGDVALRHTEGGGATPAGLH